MDGGTAQVTRRTAQYSDRAIEICLTLRVALRLAPRQIQAFRRFTYRNVTIQFFDT